MAGLTVSNIALWAYLTYISLQELRDFHHTISSESDRELQKFSPAFCHTTLDPSLEEDVQQGKCMGGVRTLTARCSDNMEPTSKGRLYHLVDIGRLHHATPPGV